MAHFCGKIIDYRGQASSPGTRASGLTVVVASGQVSVRTVLSTRDGVDYATVTLQPWQDKGNYMVLFDGPVSGLKAAEAVEA